MERGFNMMKGAQRLEKTPIAGLIPNARNARTHSEAQIAQIAASIREFGFVNPVLIDAGGVIIAGHGRVLAAQRLGLAEVPTIRIKDMTEAQRRAYVIADNKLAADAGWDKELLALELGDLRDEGFDLHLTGFTDDDLRALELDGHEGGDSGGGDSEGSYREQFGVVVICKDADEQEAVYDRLTGMGLDCKVVNT